MNTLFEITSSMKIYDLAVIGNGIAAQTFLFSLKHLDSNANKSQNFSIAHVFTEKMAPACSLRSLASVTLNGVESDAPGLGEDLRAGYFKFEEFYKKYSPDGIFPVKQPIISSNPKDHAKMLRRFKSLEQFHHPFYKEKVEGVIIDAFILDTEKLSLWFDNENKGLAQAYPYFLKNIFKNEENYELHLENHQIIRAKKVIFAMGAYSKMFSHFYEKENIPMEEDQNVIRGGSFLSRTIDLGSDSFLTIVDMTKIHYIADKKRLLIGSSMHSEALLVPKIEDLKAQFEKVKEKLSLELGLFSEYKIVTGLRHKGPRRKFIARKLGDTDLYQMNGFYKNGYTLNFLAAEEMLKLLKIT